MLFGVLGAIWLVTLCVVGYLLRVRQQEYEDVLRSKKTIASLLNRIESVLSVGVSYMDFSSRLQEVKPDFDEAMRNLSKLRGNNTNNALFALQAALSTDCYLLSREAWQNHIDKKYLDAWVNPEGNNDYLLVGSNRLAEWQKRCPGLVISEDMFTKVNTFDLLVEHLGFDEARERTTNRVNEAIKSGMTKEQAEAKHGKESGTSQVTSCILLLNDFWDYSRRLNARLREEVAKTL